MPWASSNRKATLPKNWGAIRAAVKRRAGGRCEAKQHQPTCDGIGTECDHIDDRNNHSMANLQWLSHACHQAKTLHQAKQAKSLRSTKRPKSPKPHPGELPLPPTRR
jgi:5-methylcytosine-specific restriction enzyme A